MTRNRIIVLSTLILLIALPLSAMTGAEAAFNQLKGLEGTWTGQMEGAEGAEDTGEHAGPVTHEFRISANGSVVMETMNPGTEHEMINMYHLDGDDLVLTHYCAGGNQPSMLLVADDDAMVFNFAGGTNLDPAKDGHIHGGKLKIEGDTLYSSWTSWDEGKEAGTITFVLQRQ